MPQYRRRAPIASIRTQALLMTSIMDTKGHAKIHNNGAHRPALSYSVTPRARQRPSGATGEQPGMPWSLRQIDTRQYVLVGT